MIKKLKQRIFFLIMISISTIVLGVIILFSILNYRNSINTASLIMDRFIPKTQERKELDGGIAGRPDLNEFNLENTPKDIPNDIPESIQIDDEFDFNTSIDGLYYLVIENANIVNSSDNIESSLVEELATKISSKKSESGIVDKYIYKQRKERNGRTVIMLMENEDTVLHIKLIIGISISISLISLIIIYVIAKKLSEMIVKPVEETFSKQVEFISDASHELKTPLAVIEANADVLENEVGSNKWIKYIQNEIESMNKLINELLLLAKIENVDSIKDFEEFNLSEEVEMITSMFESMAYEKNVKIKTDIQENIKMNGTKEDIEHILSTLIDNAIKHTEIEKEIIVELRKEKENIIMQVKNFGKEIPKEEREKIFERFYRVDKARNRNEKRYGLGLAIAKSTVQKYHGTIEVKYKDEYTIFEVKI